MNYSQLLATLIDQTRDHDRPLPTMADMEKFIQITKAPEYTEVMSFLVSSLQNIPVDVATDPSRPIPNDIQTGFSAGVSVMSRYFVGAPGAVREILDSVRRKRDTTVLTEEDVDV